MIIVLTRFHGDDVRMPLRPAHREKLAALTEEGVLVGAGPFADGSGAAMLYDADRERVQRAVDDDPYMTCSDVEILGIHDWSLVAGTQPWQDAASA